MKKVSLGRPISDSDACQPTNVPTAIPHIDRINEATPAAAIRGPASRTATGKGSSCPPSVGRRASRRSSGIIRAARIAESTIPLMSPPRFRNNPTPTTAPVPSMNVLP